MSCAVVLLVPAYGHWPYVARTVASFLRHSPPDAVAVVVDDRHPNDPTGDPFEWLGREIQVASGRVGLVRHHTNHGLAAAWNSGWQFAKGLRPEVVVAGNSDLLFSPGWFEAAVGALQPKRLVGPITNAPGRVAQQDVRRFVPGYRTDYDEEAVGRTAAALLAQPADFFALPAVNGFCMIAETGTWELLEERSGKGKPFPVARMTDVAYAPQRLLRKLGGTCGVAARCFVFHFRSVSRGLCGMYDRGWCRVEGGR